MFRYYECSEKNVDIDIVMLAYNHERYISQAIESVLNQETKYKYRILIGEDASTDKTREIVMKYYSKYSDRIALVLWNKNVGVNINSIQVAKMCTGKYVTTLEGDDYWTDSRKLEKQISFLEQHNEYIGTAHNIRCVDANGNLLHIDCTGYPVLEEHIYGKQQALKYELVAQTASVVYRNFWKTWKEQQYKIFSNCQANGDLKVSIYLGILGNIFYFREIMADHRRVFTGDSWTAKAHGKNLLEFGYRCQGEIKDYIEKINNVSYDFTDAYKNYIEEALIKLFCNFNRENFNVLLKLITKRRRIT